MRRLTKEHELGEMAIHSSYKSYEGQCSAHCHGFFEIEYFAKGSGEHIMDGERCEVEDGLLFFMTPLNFHSFRVEGASLYNTMFSEAICDTSVLSRLMMDERGLTLRVRGDDKAFLEMLFGELCGKYTNEEYASCLINTVLCKLLELKEESVGEASAVSRALVYIIENFQKKLTLTHVANYAGFTPTYFSALFKEETGVCFKEYLDSLRFGYAKKLLEHTDKTVMQVCTESGFDDYPNFVRRFKAHYGVTPGKVR